ncbi:MAG TPA: PilZ domain-containing protein [Bryobacterales bacterium]|nr:PilZ domain-containing protein [Bryobacterales bacterium]
MQKPLVERPLVERRRSPRYLCSHLVEVAYGGRTMPALLEDLSLEGAAVSMEAPIEPGETVELVAPGLRARAQVRYCRPRETDFQLGLEFAEEYRWRPVEWRPDHLLLPPA